MGKFRSSLKGRAKGKRWPKGQSSNSNPEIKKYRDLAKSRFFQANLGSSCLTTAALKTHDAIQSYATPSVSDTKSVSAMEDDTFSLSTPQTYETSRTFASDWSDCTNMSFTRFLTLFRSDSALHKDMLAVLAAITEVIKQNEGEETSTEYYCALVTTLEEMMIAEERSEEQLAAVLALLNMGIKSVPLPVQRTSFSNVSNKLIILLNEYKDTENNVIIRSIFGLLGVLLRNQELAIWTHSHTQQMLSSILNPFSIHSKSNWRKAAQRTAVIIVSSNSFQNEKTYNPAADRIAEFLEKTFDTCLGSNTQDTVLISSIEAGQTTMLHALGLLKDTIRFFSKSHIKTCCETAIRLISLHYPVVTSCSLQVLHNLFSAQQVVVSAKLNAQIISALYTYQPSALDMQPTLAWLAVMQQAHVHLADVDQDLSSKALPKIFNTISQLWLTQRPEIVTSATRTAEILLKDIIAPLCETEAKTQQNHECLTKCFETIELGLGYQYHHAWHQVLHVISVMFEVAGGTCSNMLISVLKTLSELRDSYKFNYNNELENAVGAAIKSMGPQVVLDIISLTKDNGDLNLDRSWLLPVLKENIRHSSIGYWFKVLLPLATYCQKRSVTLAASNNGIGAHCSELLHLQLWSLLPCFCIQPIDITENFKAIARILGMALSERKELRLSVMESLRRVIQSVKDSQNESDKAEIAKFDKNYLPILFNIYTTKPVGSDEAGHRLAALETIKVFLTITRPELSSQLFDQVLERLKTTSDSDDIFVKESLLDLIRALVSYQSIQNLDKLFKECIAQLPNVQNRKEQKKIYRVLETLCCSESENCKKYVNKKKKVVFRLLQSALNTTAVTSNGARLRCFHYLIKAQPNLPLKNVVLRAAIPEAVMGFKDVNVRCKNTSLEILKLIGEMFAKVEKMDKFLIMIISGLAGKPQLMSATIIALSYLMDQFPDSLGHNNIELLFDNILTLSKLGDRSIVGSCLVFISVYISALPAPLVASDLPKIVTSLCNLDEDCRMHYRKKFTYIFKKIIRRFGWEVIQPHISSKDIILNKQLRNIRKANNRLKAKKLLDRENQDDDEDMEDEFLVKSRPRSIEEILADSDSELEEDADVRKKAFKAYIEDDLDDIVDFNDPSVAAKITTTKPTKQNKGLFADDKKKSKDKGFKTAMDGRLIIEDLSDSESDDGKKPMKKKKKKGAIAFDGDSDSEDDTLSQAETQIVQDKKRKRSDASSVATSRGSKSTYQPGGSGIHRKLSTSSVRSGMGSEYKAKKGRGDMKRKGKADPYAYLPLSRTTLNKRKRMKLKGQYDNIIGAAKIGASKGKKAKRK